MSFSGQNLNVASVWTNEQLFEIFQYVFGVFQSSFSQPGWGPAKAELQTNNLNNFNENNFKRSKIFYKNYPISVEIIMKCMSQTAG